MTSHIMFVMISINLVAIHDILLPKANTAPILIYYLQLTYEDCLSYRMNLAEKCYICTNIMNAIQYILASF